MKPDGKCHSFVAASRRSVLEWGPVWNGSGTARRALIEMLEQPVEARELP